MIRKVEDLDVFNKAYEYSLVIHRISLVFPKIEQYELGSQVRRATKSVAMNIAEGFGKREAVAEFKRYLKMALGSSSEVSIQLRYCKDLGYITIEQYAEYTQVYGDIATMLRKLIHVWK